MCSIFKGQRMQPNNASIKSQSGISLNIDRRKALKSISTLVAATALPVSVQAKDKASPQESLSDKAPKQRLRKIATEEAFNIPEIAEAISDVVKQGGTNLDLLLLKQIYNAPRTSTPAASSQQVNVADRDRAALSLLPKLLDLNEIRLADMDTNSVDMHILSLAMPGVRFLNEVGLHNWPVFQMTV